MLYTFTELGTHTDTYVPIVKKYLDFLIFGDGQKAHCPFTKKVVESRDFYYAVSDTILSETEFSNSLSQMVLFIEKTSNRFSVVGVVYANKQNYSKEQAVIVENLRQQWRLTLIAKGLTTAWTHPKNTTGTHTDIDKSSSLPLWVSDVPLLMVRKLAPGDEPFMLTDEAKIAFIKGMKYLEKITFGGEVAHCSDEVKINILLKYMKKTRLCKIRTITKKVP